MKPKEAERGDPSGQDYVRKLSKQALHQVALNHKARTDFVDVDLRNQANAEESATRDYRGRFLFELLQNASDAIVDAQGHPERAEDRRVSSTG